MGAINCDLPRHIVSNPSSNIHLKKKKSKFYKNKTKKNSRKFQTRAAECEFTL